MKKKMKEDRIKFERELRLTDKKFNLYKEMYKKLKNEKLDIIQFGSNTDSNNVFFLKEGTGSV